MVRKFFLGLCGALGIWVGADDALFLDLSFEKAGPRAASENKVVFIDFYTTWCGPCKLMDRTTWRSPKVTDWMKEKTVPLKIDAEVETRLAAKYRVTSYPTFLFLKPDGEELGRLVGYMQEEPFLEEAEEILSGKTPMQRAREALERSGEDSPMARMDYGVELARMGRYEEALNELLWCYDEGADKDPAFVGVRGSLLLARIERLGHEYPPAREALVTRRSATEQRLREGEPDPRDLLDFAALNRHLGQESSTLALFDEIKDRPGQEANVRALIRFVFDPLLESQRYRELDEAMDLDSEIQVAIDRYERMDAFQGAGNIPDAQREHMKESRKRYLINTLAKYYQVFEGVGKLAEAAKVAERTLAIDDSADTYNELAWNGYLTGAASAADLNFAEKAYSLSLGGDAYIVDTLARVLGAVGQNERAVGLVTESLARFEKHADRTMLQECLTDLKRE